MKKKTIIIIVLLVAAAFIAWKKGLFAKLFGGANTMPAVNDVTQPSDLSADDIVTGTSMLEYEKEKCREWVRNIENQLKNGNWSAADFQKRMSANSTNYNQQLVLDALYQMYQHDTITREYYQKIAKEVKSL